MVWHTDWDGRSGSDRCPDVRDDQCRHPTVRALLERLDLDVTVEWSSELTSRLHEQEVPEHVAERTAVAVVDRRQSDASPSVPSECSVGDANVVVLPRTDGGPSVEVWACSEGDASTPHEAVSTLILAVAFDAYVSDCLETLPAAGTAVVDHPGLTRLVTETKRLAGAFALGEDALAIEGLAGASTPVV